MIDVVFRFSKKKKKKKKKAMLVGSFKFRTSLWSISQILRT
ncbi:unnamed protein product [Arabidopsis halleri]